MPLSYLYNKKNHILSISDRLLTFNNIKIILEELPYVIEHGMNDLHIHEAKTILDYQKEILNIDHTNINISLDIINQNDNIYYNNFMLYFYNQNINLNFKNYPMYNLLDKYIDIIQQMTKNININQFGFNKDLLTPDGIPTKVNELLNIRKNNTDSNLALIDIFLKDIKNTPESQNDLYNYIYILRKFPMFRLILNHYLNKNESDIYKIISENNLEIESETELLLPLLFNFSDHEKILQNITNLFKKDYCLNDFFYMIDTYDIDVDLLIKTYNDIDFQTYGFNSIDIFVNLDALINNFLTTTNYDIYKVLSLYFKINSVEINLIKEISTENLNILISTFFMNLYIIYDYLNLNQFSNINELIEIYKDTSNDTLGINPENILTDLLFYIYLSYYVFKDQLNDIYRIITGNINLLKHFFYIIQYSKNTLPTIFPLIIFLSCSSRRIKVIYEYKNNYILEFLNDYYDIIFKESQKIMIKRPM